MAARAEAMNSLRAAAAAELAGLVDRAHEPGADDHAVGDRADLGRLRGRGDAEADRDRDRRVGLRRGDQVAERRGSSSRSPVVGYRRRGRRSPRPRRRSAPVAPGASSARPGGSAPGPRPAKHPRPRPLLRRQVGHDRAGGAGVGELRERSGPRARIMFAYAIGTTGSREAIRRNRRARIPAWRPLPALAYPRRGSRGRRRAGRSRGRRVRSGRRRHPHRRRRPRPRCRASGKPPIMYGISAARPSDLAAANPSQSPPSSPSRSPGSAVPCRHGRRASRRRPGPSSPRPRTPAGEADALAGVGLSSTQAIACEGSSAGMIPSRRASSRKALSASASVTAS